MLYIIIHGERNSKKHIQHTYTSYTLLHFFLQNIRFVKKKEDYPKVNLLINTNLDPSPFLRYNQTQNLLHPMVSSKYYLILVYHLITMLHVYHKISRS